MAGELITLGWMTPWRAIKVALQSEKSRNGLQKPLGPLFHQGHAIAQVGVCFKRNNSCFDSVQQGSGKKLRTATGKKSGDWIFDCVSRTSPAKFF
jgi:hypothetical protein